LSTNKSGIKQEAFGMLSENELERYRAFWKKNELENEKRYALTREKALFEVERISEILKDKYNVKRVILFGSVLDEDRFHDGSDIDIAVEGLDKESYFKVLGELLMESSFSIDLVPLEEASSLLRQRISRGQIIHERKQDPGT
jgi:predicted nucleotidyltransferase